MRVWPVEKSSMCKGGVFGMMRIQEVKSLEGSSSVRWGKEGGKWGEWEKVEIQSLKEVGLPYFNLKTELHY